jgi:hypothetical protein
VAEHVGDWVQVFTETGEPLRIVDGADTPGGSMGDCFS